MLHCHQAWGDEEKKNTVAFFCMVKNAMAIKTIAVAFNLILWWKKTNAVAFNLMSVGFDLKAVAFN